MRAKFTEAERNHQAKLIDVRAAASRMASELDNARAASAVSARLGQEQSAALQQPLQDVSQYKAEADTLRALMAQFQPSSKPVRRKRSPGGRRVNEGAAGQSDCPNAYVLELAVSRLALSRKRPSPH